MHDVASQLLTTEIAATVSCAARTVRALLAAGHHDAAMVDVGVEEGASCLNADTERLGGNVSQQEQNRAAVCPLAAAQTGSGRVVLPPDNASHSAS
jgi:hypothetical protein